ncbi:hypothetical protein CRM22_006146 [Opisthorchis felineus]|uniref:GDP-Man:Man(3)GlcNAc(2)-PP-Dol alpha-1,2-mannosyltransferase n=1 Tax=Opisthorchis felineus TaxID=147828 RepID=A0A4S2LP12_OPIFE|nr:hypothetical protein CRM22_006146 [Opisthorchis felineus]
MLTIVLSISLAAALLCVPLVVWLLARRRQRVRQWLFSTYGTDPNCTLIGFFHPYCNSGGGGERVLWTSIKAMLLERKPRIFIIYTNDSICLRQPEQVFDNVKRIFDVSLDVSERHANPIHFVPIRSARFLSPSTYPIFTLGGQALGSIFVALEALIRCPPDVFLDTTGFAFTLPIAKRLARCTTATYVHYPTVSIDMVTRVASSVKPSLQANAMTSLQYNNANWIRNSRVFSWIKLGYYHMVLIAYRWAGSPRNVDLVMTNSSWTRNHILSLWGGKPLVLFPPCPVPTQKTAAAGRMPWIMSIGQFRPEKNHELQLEAFRLFLKRLHLLDSPQEHDYRLLLVGGCRDARDLLLVDRLKELARSWGLIECVQFHVNVPYETLQSYFRKCMINLHTMVDEHFGIGVVEGMAAGLITVAHNSGGPLTDIIGPAMNALPSGGDSRHTNRGVGFLAATAEEYANCFEYILTRMTPDQLEALRGAALSRSRELFSDECFSRGWLNNIKLINV